MEIINFDSVDSTNKYIKENHDSLEDLTFVNALFQSNGKGREDRVWNSDKNLNLLFSFLIKDKNIIKKYKSLSIGTATLIARFLEIKGIKNVMVKWPNDVYVNNKKICGILLEGEMPKYLVVGVGLNVNQTEFKGDFRVPPTSMKNELKNDFDLNKLKDELFSFLTKHIKQINFEGKTLRFYSKHDYLLGKNVEINKVKGFVKGITKDFEIIVGNNKFSSGEITIL